MPPDSRVIGAARSDLGEAGFRDRARGALEEHVSPADLEPDTVERFCAQLHYAQLDASRSGEHWAVLQALLDPARVRVFYLATSPDLYGAICRNLGSAGLVTPAVPRRAGKADRSRSGIRAADQRRGRRGLRGGADLPHRPLPRQGNCAEPAGVALRQHDLRTAVVGGRHRPRADHGVGNRGVGRTGGLLRPRGRVARHGAEPPAAVVVPDRDGAAAVARCRPGARREAEGAARATPARAARRGGSDRARPVCPGGDRRQTGAKLRGGPGQWQHPARRKPSWR